MSLKFKLFQIGSNSQGKGSNKNLLPSNDPKLANRFREQQEIQRPQLILCKFYSYAYLTVSSVLMYISVFSALF